MSEESLLAPEELLPSQDLALRILAELDALLLGQEAVHRMLLIAILSRGNMLLEGLPGVGKTALIKTLGKLLQLEFKRIQFTPDLLPSDILGGSILQVLPSGERQMVFQPGAIFANLVLADEINRASPKTQSAMLEAMQERSVTLLGETRPLPEPFFVLASQNPIELEGTYPIPEAQLDRFLFKLQIGSVGADTLTKIIVRDRRGELPQPGWCLSRAELEQLFAVMDRIYLSCPVAAYIGRLVAASHPDAPAPLEAVTRYVTYGASPRAAIGMAEAARAAALLCGRPAVGFEDVRMVAPAVLNHRIILNYQARLDKISSADITAELLAKIDPAGIDWPSELEPRRS